MKYYVSASVYRSGDGSEKYPFKTIREAAKFAMPGDEVIVGAGTYHEYVDPENAMANTSNWLFSYPWQKTYSLGIDIDF